MSERDKAVCAAARVLVDAPPRHHPERVGDRPEGVSEEDWQHAQGTAERLYVDTMEDIEWSRVLIEARGRHRALHPGQHSLAMAIDIGMESFEDICAACIREVLLARGTHPLWDVEPTSPRYVLYQPPPLPELVAPAGLGLTNPDRISPPDDGRDLERQQMNMCPHCGTLVGVVGLVPTHPWPAGSEQVCPGSEQNPRCPESDARPLWNGEANPHFSRR